MVNPVSRTGYRPLDSTLRRDQRPASFVARAGGWLVDVLVAIACVPLPVGIITSACRLLR